MRVKLLSMVIMKAIAAFVEPKNQTTSGGSGGGGIIVNACCPSLCRTDIGRNFGVVSQILMVPFQALLARTAEQGSRTLFGATALSSESHGRLWSHDCLYM